MTKKKLKRLSFNSQHKKQKKKNGGKANCWSKKSFGKKRKTHKTKKLD